MLDVLDASKDSSPNSHLTVIGGGAWTEANRTALKAEILQKLPQLVAISSNLTSALMTRHFGHQSQQVLSSLDANPELQFQFLRSLIGKNDKKGEAADKSSMGYAAVVVGDGSAPSSVLAAVPSAIPLTPELHELYVRLLCKYAPDSVLAHISAYHDYNIDHILVLCKQHNVDDASAYLLEGTGDVPTALKLLLDVVGSKLDLVRKACGKTDRQRWLSASDRNAVFADLAHVKELDSAIQSAEALCIRHAKQADKESEALWFMLLDRFMEW